MINWDDIINKEFGYLTILGRDEDYITPKGAHYPQAICKCRCGKIKSMIIYPILKEKVVSCGCYHIESARNIGRNNKNYNNYDLSGEYGIGYDCNNNIFLFDLDDYDLIKNYCWNLDSTNNYFKTIHNNKKLYLHRLIMGCNYNDGKIVDHINRERYDCRRKNLRFTTASNNLINQTLRSDNKSGTIGVSWYERDQLWEATIKYQGKIIHLGRFKDIRLAIEARLKGVKEYYNLEYSPQANMIKNLNI